MKKNFIRNGNSDYSEKTSMASTDRFCQFSAVEPVYSPGKGEIKTGARPEPHIQPFGSRGPTFRPTVLHVEPERTTDRASFIPGLFDGEHSFTIEAVGENRSSFTQREIFTGLLVPLFARSLDMGTRRGFEEMNQALKAQAEQDT